nr:head maturation protease, ClpP-related [Desulforamulus reducens]
MDSWGGDTTAAAGIYNALKEHKGKVTVKIDGKAVSAGSVIAMAGDEVYMSPVGIMMIHNPWTRVAGEAKDMNHAADVLNEIKDSIITAYQMKTGRSRSKISKMMDNETWMSAKTAMAEGFIDGILYADGQQELAEPVENSFMFNRQAIMNSASASVKKFLEQYSELSETGQLAGLNFAPDTKPPTQGQAPTPQPANKTKGDELLEIKNTDELKQAYPELVAQVEAAARDAGKTEGLTEGAKNERERIKSIDEISNTIASDLVAKAKYDEPMTAQELAFQALKTDAAKGQQHLDTRNAELNNSGANNVAAGTPPKSSDEEKYAVLMDKAVAAANAKRNKGAK